MRLVDVADEIAAAVRVLSRHRLGAIIVWDPAGMVAGGVTLDARVTSEILVAVVIPEHINSISRGAVVIRGDRVERAGVPLAWGEIIERVAELAAGVAVAVDADTGAIRIADRTGQMEFMGVEALADALRRGRP